MIEKNNWDSASANLLLNAKANVNSEKIVYIENGYNSWGYKNFLVYKQTLLYTAIARGSLNIVKELLDLKADVNASRLSLYNEDVFPVDTPLMLAAGMGALECIKLLLNARADITVKCGDTNGDSTENTHGLTAMQIASRHKKIECVREILKAEKFLELEEKQSRELQAALVSQLQQFYDTTARPIRKYFCLTKIQGDSRVKNIKKSCIDAKTEKELIGILENAISEIGTSKTKKDLDLVNLLIKLKDQVAEYNQAHKIKPKH